MTENEYGVLARVEAKVDRLDDKLDAAILKQQELTDYQKTANGSLATMKGEIIDLKSWQHCLELRMAREDGAHAATSDTLLSRTQWKTLMLILTGFGTIIGVASAAIDFAIGHFR